MSVWVLKLIAMTAMLVDHIGYIFFPQVLALRVIGRISFPIFAFLIAEGVMHTHSKPRYLLRLSVCALLSEVPFRLSFLGGNAEFGARNVLVTLLLGALACIVWDGAAGKPLLLLIPIFASAVFLQCDYGWYGAAAVLLFFVLRAQPKYVVAAGFFMLTTLYCALQQSFFELPALAALIPLLCYNGEKGRYSAKYFFYAFYPVHLLLLWGLSRIIFA